MRHRRFGLGCSAWYKNRYGRYTIQSPSRHQTLHVPRGSILNCLFNEIQKISCSTSWNMFDTYKFDNIFAGAWWIDEYESFRFVQTGRCVCIRFDIMGDSTTLQFWWSLRWVSATILRRSTTWSNDRRNAQGNHFINELLFIRVDIGIPQVQALA